VPKLSPIVRLVAWLLGRLLPQEDIGRGGAGGLYMTRWTLWTDRQKGGRQLVLHRFFRSDLDEFHDHPRPFVSLILAGGYHERTPATSFRPWCPSCRMFCQEWEGRSRCCDRPIFAKAVAGQRRRWYGPGAVLERPAAWAHALEIPPGRECWTLVWMGRRERDWGFHCPSGWIPWRRHVANRERTGNGCEGEP
jgi:hypothetical protein